MIRVCVICNKEFEFIPYKKNPRFIKQACSRFCSGRIVWGKMDVEARNKKVSKAKMGEKNPMWAGDKVGYQALHVWVARHFPKPAFCEMCLKVPPYDLANQGIYNRELKNWKWLCRKCHMISDGRLERLVQARRDRI